MARTDHGYPGVYNSTFFTLTSGEGSALATDASGVLISTARRADAFQATITSADATTATQVKAKTASKKIYITDLVISVDTAMSIQLQDDAGTPEVLMEQIYLPANSVFSKAFNTPLVVATNQDLDVITSAAGNISVTCTGYVV